MSRLVFVRAGHRKMSFVELSDGDARQAEKEGWAQIVDDPRTNAHSYSVSIEPDHIEKANAYFDRAHGYENRELSSGPSPAVNRSSSPLAEPDGGADAPQRQAGEVAPPSRARKQAGQKSAK